MNALPWPARVCLGAGSLGLLLCLLNQGSAAELSPALERASVLASLLAVGLLLVAVLWTRAAPVAPERAKLSGPEGLELRAGLPKELELELGWGSRMLLTATPAASVLVFWRGTILLRRGVLADASFQPGAICERAAQNGKAISLVDLRLYPGREEFRGLPEGTPAVLVQPIGTDGWLLLGGWSPRCFSRSDERWVEGWAQKLRTSLEPAFSADPREAGPAAGSEPAPPAS
jgi:hypothetical protein